MSWWKEVSDFQVKAFHNGEFRDVGKADLMNQVVRFVFYPADFTFVCPTELSDLADLYEEFQKSAPEVHSVSTDSRCTQACMMLPPQSRRSVPHAFDPTGKLSETLKCT